MTASGPGRGSTTRALPMVLFGMLTLLTFAGPLAIVVVGRGGDRPNWPPDRAVEWWVFLGVTIGFVGLFLACLVDGIVNLRRMRRQPPPSRHETTNGREVDP